MKKHEGGGIHRDLSDPEETGTTLERYDAFLNIQR